MLQKLALKKLCSGTWLKVDRKKYLRYVLRGSQKNNFSTLNILRRKFVAICLHLRRCIVGFSRKKTD